MKNIARGEIIRRRAKDEERFLGAKAAPREEVLAPLQVTV
jgi:hypothetical protein